MTAFAEEDILDRRLVSEGPDGRSEWLLVRQGDTTLWIPFWTNPEGEVIVPSWMPLPGSQQAFLSCPVYEALYHGTRGPGKTLTLLMDFARGVGQGYGSAWRGVLFRRHFKDLDDVVRKAEEWYPKIFPGFRFLRSKSEYMGLFPDGEALLLRQGVGEEDYDPFHGHEYPWIGFEELTQWEDLKLYLLMQSCCRPPRQGVPCRIRATTNPYGPGHNVVKRRFRLPEMDGRVLREPGEMPRVAVKGMLRENFLLLHSAPMYETQIRQAATNKAQAAAWLEGDWTVTAGGMIDDLWDAAVHVVPTPPISVVPRSWTVTRAYDHGQSAPFAVGWFLESSGEPFEYEGHVFGRVRGDVYLWGEWYGTSGNPNEGLRMSARKIAEGIRDRQRDMGVDKIVRAGPADTEIWNRHSDRDGRSPADDMEDTGVSWERADKSAGSRHRGWEMLRTFVADALPGPDGTRERPGFYVCDECRYALDLLPPMPRDPDDLDDVPKRYEDHLPDMVRYRLSWELPTMWRGHF